ncbi:hypothetical protein BXU11_03110 [Flavobacterium sp. LM5]|uniref:ComEC/Rec2 family competence protein n=1 Tax=Flavobacterium sp. LM5 TaxID=1938610 RepID=UPI0009929C97|nr:ComEC/Rec2 family competence protein [Flavobacterium sp. LM5]OOV28936.1 hypothetical protein BXU11_03110 [Flavobacterium sp. LM5]
MNLLRFPLFKFSIGFLIGLVSAYHVSFTFFFLMGLTVVAVLLFCIAYFLVTKNDVYHWFFDGSALWLSIVIGINVLTLHTQSNSPFHYNQDPSIYKSPHEIKVVIKEKLKSNTFSDRFIVSVESINERHQTGLLLLHLQKNKYAKHPIVGTRLRFNSVIVPHALNKNPSQFDYATYLKNKQIYAQIYLVPEEISYLSTPEKSVWYFASSIRDKIVDNLHKSGFDPKALPVAMALILGQQQDIDPNIAKDYQYAGAVHILSVSGLHIGSLVFFIHFLLGPIPNTKNGRLLKLIISLSLLTLFGILAGLAASVVRSITMFAILAIGQYLNRSTSIFHTLMVSMVLILLFQPYFLFDVGFQLSYVALFFIVWLQPMLTLLWSPKHKILQFFWDLLTVSFAAQIGTFPLSVYYFHQFPGLFFVTNLLVLPLIGVIMFLGVVVVIIAYFSIVPFWIFKPLEMGISFMNAIIHQVASFESFIFVDIPFNAWLFWSSFMLIFTFVFWVKRITFYRTVAILFAIILFQISFFIIKLKYESTQEWIVLNTTKQTIVCERVGQKVAVFANQKDRENILKNTAVRNYVTATFSAVSKITPLGNVAYFLGNRILILDSTVVKIPLMPVDIVLITHSPKVNFDRLLQSCNPKKVVVDASNYKSLVTLWKKSCKQKNIPIHVTSEKGYFALKK